MGAKDRLVGADASLYKASFGNTVATGLMISGSWYKIITISGTTGGTFGSAIYKPEDLILGNGQTMNAANTAQLVTFTAITDCSGFDLAFSRDEIEVTVLTDQVKKYRPGKTDLTGTIRGINFISEMKQDNSLANRFFRMVSATAANVSTVYAVDESELFGQFFIQDDTTTSGETQAFLFGQIELYGYNLGAAVTDAQAWESSVRFIGNDPMMYFKANA